ncbi:hypothetical protein FNV43_RR21653 [Rhamnella rubrinervis]|uniref:Uncharacterized protein n=1 Tax=Rhamnella rubrinervis TaxID=2594499 RepID=A0A8K0DUP1_9ROSA|nr:hypothetical protein FNV43_RR21653 [Rhamnella rubrinervis]
MDQLVSSLLRVLCLRRDAPIAELVAAPMVVPVSKPRTLWLQFNDDPPYSLGVSYQDFGLDKASTQQELEQKRHKGLEVPPVATMGHEEDEDLEEDPEEEEDPEDFLTHKDSLELVNPEDFDHWDDHDSD